MATMWTLDEYCRLNLTRVPSIKSKTSKTQAWGKPNKKRKVIHKPVMETKLARPKHVSVVANNKRQGIVSTLFDPRPLEKRCIDVDGLKQMSKKLQDSKSNIPYAKVLPCTVDDIQVTNTIVGVVAHGSLLEMHLKGDQTQSPSAILTASNVNNTCGSSFPDLPLKCIEKKPVDEYNHKELKLPVHVTLHDSHEIFRHTLGQAKNVLWKKERQFRLTASNFGKIINRKCEYTDSFIQSICNPVDISTNPWVKYGNENEDKVAKLYTASMRHEGKVVQLYNVGLCVNPTLPHLGASIDRGVYDPSDENKYGGLEVKTCPKAGNLGLSIQEAIDHKEFKSSFFLQKKDGDISLKRSHNYYYQVQGELALTALPWIDFVAYSGLGTIYKERVHLDEPLWESTILPKLNLFYFCNQNAFQ